MPNIRVMNWNIESLSSKKIQYDGFLLAVARTVVAANVDVLVIVELRKVNPDVILQQLSNQLNQLNPGGGNNWRGYFYSHDTATERYGLLIRDLDLVRPVGLLDQNIGTEETPITDLLEHQLDVLPQDWPAPPNPAYIPTRQILPLIDLFVTDPLARRSKKKQKFAGKRHPCLILLKVHTPTDYFVPIVACHYGATRKGNNALAQFQVDLLKELHIAELYSFYDEKNGQTAADAYSRYLNIGGQAVRVQELAFLGDFNMDFMDNQAGRHGSIAARNRSAYNTITPTEQFGGSTTPAAVAPPVVAGNPDINPVAAPEKRNIPVQTLRAAVTAQGTILKKLSETIDNCDRPYWCLRGAAFDNFFYGGTQLSQTAIADLQPPNAVSEAGEVINMPNNIVRGEPRYLEDFNIVPMVWDYVTNNNGVKGTETAFGLLFGFKPTASDKLVGARLVSDHLPVVVQFPCP